MADRKRPMKRREFVEFMAAVSAGGTFFGNTIRIMARDGKKVTREMVIEAEKLTGIKMTNVQRNMIIPALQNYLHCIEYIQEISMPPEIAPKLHFLSDTTGIWTLTSKKIKES